MEGRRILLACLPVWSITCGVSDQVYFQSLSTLVFVLGTLRCHHLCGREQIVGRCSVYADSSPPQLVCL